jgi:hypothetical protein
MKVGDDGLSKSISPYKQQNEELVRELCGQSVKFSFKLGNLAVQQLLQCLCPDGIVTASACAKVMEFSEKENKVKEVCDLSKVKSRPDDGRISS